MDDLGINKWLDETYGRTVEGLPLFRLIWSTNVTEFRKSRFIDFLGDIQLRDVIETRETLKYPFAQDRWIIERICLIDERVRDLGLQTDLPYSYEEVYIFQDKEGNSLQLTRYHAELAVYFFLQSYSKTYKERADLRMAALAEKDRQKRNKTRDSLGEGRSPYGFVLDSIKR